MEDIDEILADLGPQVLRRPVHIVLPSTSLRLHLQRRLLEQRKRGIAGLVMQTHHGLAAQLARKSGFSLDTGPDLFGLFARRFAAGEPALSRSLDHLADGYRAILIAVRDLLDAGLDPAHHEALEDVLDSEGLAAASRASVGRAHAIVRVAVKTAAAINEIGLERSSTLLSHAIDIVRGGGAGEASTVLVYGYADATGLTIDFLQALLETYGGRLYLDRPADPANPAETDTGTRFSRHFTERLTHSLPGELPEPATDPPGTVEMFKALGGDAEVREVGRRIRRLIDAGQPPEGIGVVARNLTPYREPIRIQFDRLGIPFSGIGAVAPRSPAAWRGAAILDLLRLHSRAPVERWIGARNASTLAAPEADVRMAFQVLGAGRLEDAALVDPGAVAISGHLTLPVGLGLTSTTNDDGVPRRFASRKRLSREIVESEVDRARAALDRLKPSGSPREIGHHVDALRRLLTDDLGWGENDRTAGELLDAAEQALRSLPREFAITDQEFQDLLASAWDGIHAQPLGGAGAGVQILDVTEARSRTFDHLFVLGLNRGRFPRNVVEDPVLPDALRRVLARSGHSVLPDLPLKLHGFAEERFLFAQLLASSPAVTLSWQEVDDDHTFQTPSPLVERLRWSEGERAHPSWKEPPTAQALFSKSPGSTDDPELRTAYESAVLTGMFGSRDRGHFRRVMEVALDEASATGSGPQSPAAIAEIRTRILSEIDPAPGQPARERLGPYFGLVGPPIRDEDPRLRDSVYVTTLERMIVCPWQTYLRKVLKIEPVVDPLEILPAIEPRILGNLVHEVLERIVTRATGKVVVTLDEARGPEGTNVPWPSAEELSRLVKRSASRIVSDEGIALPGFDRVLARFAAAFLESARHHDWPDGKSRNAIVAAEFHSSLDWPAAGTRIGFRADRLDRTASGLVLTDYKTGAPYFKDAQRAPDEKAIRKKIVTGRALQGMAYAVAAGGADDRGRYLFLAPEMMESVRASIEMRTTPSETVEAFTDTVNAALAAWQRGTFFPRVSEPTENAEPSACGWCELAEACLRGDSGARMRLREWADGASNADQGDVEADADAATTFALWLQPAKGAGR